MTMTWGESSMGWGRLSMSAKVAIPRQSKFWSKQFYQLSPSCPIPGSWWSDIWRFGGKLLLLNNRFMITFGCGWAGRCGMPYRNLIGKEAVNMSFLAPSRAKGNIVTDLMWYLNHKWAEHKLYRQTFYLWLGTILLFWEAMNIYMLWVLNYLLHIQISSSLILSYGLALKLLHSLAK